MLTVTSRRNVGWLEQTTLGGLRVRLVRELQRRDRRDRFAICYPETGAEPPVTVHTKLLDVDDCLLYLGSANLSNRSMRLDSEIGIALDGRARPDLRSAIRGLRLALLGEHLGLDPETLAEGPEADGVLAALRRRRRGRRRLVPLSVEEDEIPDMLEPVARLADPEGALSLDGVLHELLPADSEEDGNALLTRFPVASVRHHDISVPGREPRGVLEVELNGPRRRILTLVTQLGLGRGERRRQAQRLASLTRSRPETPLVLLGDLNEWWPFGAARRVLRRELGATPSPATFPARLPVLALDRIWCRPASVLRRVAVHRSRLARIASDHLPVVARLELPAP